MIKNISYKLLDPQFNNTKDYVYGIILLLSEITIVAKTQICLILNIGKLNFDE